MGFVKHVVQYGGYTLPNPVGIYTYTREPNGAFTFSQDFVVEGTSAADFNTKVQSAEAECNDPNAALTVTWNGQTYLSLNPASNTALIVRAKCDKVGTRKDLQYSRQYRLTVTGKLPHSATWGSADGTGEFKVSETRNAANVASYRFEGEIRAEAANGAYAAKDDIKSDIVTWLRSYGSPVEVAAGDNYPRYNITNEVYTPEDHTDGVVGFAITYTYRPFPEAESSPYVDSDFVITDLQIVRAGDERQGYNPFSPNGDIPEAYQVTARVEVDTTSTAWSSLPSLWSSKLRDLFRYHLVTSWGATGVSTTSATHMMFSQVSLGVNLAKSEINVSFRVDAAPGGVLRIQSEIEYIEDKRETDMKLADGREHTYDTQSPGIEWRAVQTHRGTILHKQAPSPSSWKRDLQNMSAPGGHWYVKRQRAQYTPYRARTLDGNEVFVIDFTLTRELKYEVREGSDQGYAGFVIGNE